MNECGIDVVRSVWMAEYEPITVSPSGDCPGYVQITTEGSESEEFWGKCRLVMPKGMALKLAEAIKACAEEQQ